MQTTRIHRLRKIKERQGIGYEPLAREIGVSFMSVYRWLRKGVIPRNRLVVKAIDRFLARNGYVPANKERRGVRRPYR